MWKLIKIIILILAFGFGGFILWMNLTPGYFQPAPCGDEIIYATDAEIKSFTADCFFTSGTLRSLLGHFLLPLSRLDFNRGPKSSPSTNPAENLPEPTNPSYICPKTEWVNCMPILTTEAQKSCTEEYLDWAKNNCLGFKGAAY